MHFGPKRTAGISGHYSEARSGSMRKSSGDAEAGGKQWKSVEDKRKVRKTCGSWWKTRKGSEGVRKAWKRSGRPWERAEEAGGLGKVTVRYMTLRLAQDSQQFEGACTTVVKMLENLKDYRTLLPVASTTAEVRQWL